MLLTTCPNCSAQFKVQPEQLNVRQGRVMCGRCREVFNAFQSLTRIEEPAHVAHAATPVAPLPELESETGAPESTVEVADPLFLREEPSALPAAFSAETPQTDSPFRDQVPSFPAAMDTVEDLDGKKMPTASHTWSAAVNGERFKAGVTPGAADNPLLADASQRKEAIPARTRTWVAGSVLLVLVLSLQATFIFRSAIAQSVPEARGVLVKACDLAGCSIPWGRDEAAIRIEASDLIESTGKTGRILLTATVANRGKAQQDFPSLELKLTDNGNQVLLSRILAPAEYLGRVPTRDEGLAANAELFVNLTVEIAGKLPASGYGVRAFYP